MRIHLIPQVLCLCIAGYANALDANTLCIDATDRGYYFVNSAPPHFPDLTNYLARVSPPGDRTRSFFVFDLSAVNTAILTASLRLYNPGVAIDGHDGYYSANPSEIYTTYDVVTPIATLLAPPYAGGQPIYADLGSGVVYGSQVVTASDNGRFVTVPLNSDFIAGANSSSGLFAIGGAISSGQIFGYTGDFPLSATQLVLTTVPEPSTIAILLAGAIGLLAYAWRRRR
jgi:hypothetical protein